MENLPWAMAGGERGATGHWKTPQEENRGDCSPCFQLCPGQSEAGLESCYKIHPNKSFTCLWHHPGRVPLLKSIKQTVTAESRRNSGSTASQTAAELSQAAAASSCQPLLCQRSATATLIQKGPALARWSCRDAAGAAQPQSGFPAGTGGTHQSSQGSPQWPLAKSSTTRNSQGALGPSFLPAKPMHRAGNALKQL